MVHVYVSEIMHTTMSAAGIGLNVQYLYITVKILIRFINYYFLFYKFTITSFRSQY